MRILHSFSADSLKVSVFVYNAKYSIKVQDQGYELLLPLGDVNVVELPQLVEFYFTDKKVIDHFKQQIQQLHNQKLSILKEVIIAPNDFEVII